MVSFIALLFTLLGAVVWLIIGIFSFNIVTWIVGAGVIARIIYCIVGVSALWLIGMLIYKRGKIFNTTL